MPSCKVGDCVLFIDAEYLNGCAILYDIYKKNILLFIQLDLLLGFTVP